MLAEVLAVFPSWSRTFEGRLAFPYLDVRGLVTTGVGNLIDPAPIAFTLPWLRPDGSRASLDDVKDAWNAVKARTDLAPHGGAAFAKVPAEAGVTPIHLSETAIDDLVRAKLLDNENVLRGRFPAWESWPGAAQLAALSIAWAAGPHFNFPKMAAALNARDFARAAGESHLNEEANPGLHGRNVANEALLLGAARVEQEGLAQNAFLPGGPTPSSAPPIALASFVAPAAAAGDSGGTVAFAAAALAVGLWFVTRKRRRS